MLRNIKKLGNFRKSARKCTPDDLFTFASDDVISGEQTREQLSYWSFDWDITQHIGITT